MRLISPIAFEGSGGLSKKSGRDEMNSTRGSDHDTEKLHINVMTVHVCKRVSSNQLSKNRKVRFSFSLLSMNMLSEFGNRQAFKLKQSGFVCRTL